MKQYCPLTGIDLSADGATNGFKKMCLNCIDCGLDGGVYSCHNENVLQAGKNKILLSLPEGYEIETLELKPMKLKDPTKKCSNHQFDVDGVMRFITHYYGLDNSTDNENENAPE